MMTTMINTERNNRMRARVTCLVSCSIQTLDGGDAMNGLVDDLSEEGARVMGGPAVRPSFIQEGASVALELLVQPIAKMDRVEKRICCLAKVVWVNDSVSPCVGLELIAMMPYYRQRLRDLIGDYEKGLR